MLTDPALALRAVFLLAAELRAATDGVATRVSVAVGPGDRARTGGDLNAAAGEAFASRAAASTR